MPKLIHATSPTLRVVIVGAFVLAALFVGAGIWFVYLGATGATNFTFFGQAFESKNVGIAALFLGAVTVVLLLRRSLSSLDNVVRTESVAGTQPATPEDAWPDTKNEASLRRAIKALSKRQWAILEAVGDSDGAVSYSLLERLGPQVGASEFMYRLGGLVDEELIVRGQHDKVYLSDDVRRLLGQRALAVLRG